MYGLGLVKGMLVTLKNLVLPSRRFTLHQYPDRKVGPLGLAKHKGTNVFSLALRSPVQFAKSVVGLVSVPDRYPAASAVPRRGVHLVRGAVHWMRELRQVLPPGHHRDRHRP